MADTKTEKTVAEELRAGAARARETFTPAATARVVHRTRVAICGSHTKNPTLVCHGCAYFDTEDPVLARLLVALLNAREPLASWLEEYVRWANDSITDYEEGNGPVHESDYCDGEIGKNCRCFDRALAVARVLNSGAP